MSLHELSPARGLSRVPTGNQKAGALPSLGSGPALSETHLSRQPLGSLGGSTDPSPHHHQGAVSPNTLAPVHAPPPPGGQLAPLSANDLQSPPRSANSGSQSGTPGGDSSTSGSPSGGAAEMVMAGSPVLARRQRAKLAAANAAGGAEGGSPTASSPTNDGSPLANGSFGGPLNGSSNVGVPPLNGGNPNSDFTHSNDGSSSKAQTTPICMHDILDPHVDGSTEIFLGDNHDFGNVQPPPSMLGGGGNSLGNTLGNVLVPPAMQQHSGSHGAHPPPPGAAPRGGSPLMDGPIAGRSGLAPLEKSGLSPSGLAIQQ